MARMQVIGVLVSLVSPDTSGITMVLDMANKIDREKIDVTQMLC
jgi:hypothetical protein